MYSNRGWAPLGVSAAARRDSPCATKSCGRTSSTVTTAPTNATIAAKTRMSLRPCRNASRPGVIAFGAEPAVDAEGDEVRERALADRGRARPADGARERLRRPLTRCWKTAPQAAMPVAMPTWRKVELMPDAMPARCGCDDADGGGRQRRVGHADADAGDDEAGQQRRPVVAGVEPRHQQQADADQHAARRRGTSARRALGELARRPARRRTTAASPAGSAGRPRARE